MEKLKEYRYDLATGAASVALGFVLGLAKVNVSSDAKKPMGVLKTFAFTTAASVLAAIGIQQYDAMQKANPKVA